MKEQSIEALTRQVLELGHRVERMTIENAEMRRMWMNEHGSFVLQNDALPAFHRLVRWLVKEWGDKFAMETLTKRLTNLLSIVASGDNESATATLKSMISELDSFSSEVTAFIPIEGLILEDRSSWSLGKIVFHKYSPSFLQDRVKCDWLTPDFMRRESRARVWAEVRVDAEPNRAVSRADELLEGIVDVLRFWMALISRPGTAIGVGIEGEVATGSRLRIAQDAQGPHIIPNRAHSVLPFIISARSIELIGQAGILFLADVAGTRGGFLGLILSGLRLYGRAKSAPGDAERLLWLMMTLECFLSSSESPVVQSIAESVPVFFDIGVARRLEMKKELQRLYKFRSKIAHGEWIEVLPGDVASLDEIVQSFLLALIGQRGEIRDKKHLLAILEQRRLSN